MKNGYQDFFKKSRSAKQTSQSHESTLKSKLNFKSRRQQNESRRRPPVFAVVVFATGLVFAVMGYLNPEKFEQALDRVEAGVFSSAIAADENAAKVAQTGEPGVAGNADATKAEGEKKCVEQKGFSEEELSHFNKLNERKKELDRRDAELTALEEELHKQKEEIETRILRLERIREEVANTLKDRVEVDQERVTTLVDFYSNMKPKQAAEIFSKLNEDLAVEVLGKMKKKNAADILNLLDPTKSRALSEKFAGYKRR